MFKDYSAKAITAKIMSEISLSDGDTAYQIINFDVDSEGFLRFDFKLMPVIPVAWNDNSYPLRGCLKEGIGRNFCF